MFGDRASGLNEIIRINLLGRKVGSCEIRKPKSRNLYDPNVPILYLFACFHDNWSGKWTIGFEKDGRTCDF
ncbi:hypothetical protein GCM10028807_56160 [Spirosoma daeguense]